MPAERPTRRWRRLVWRAHGLLGLVAGAGLLIIGVSGSAVVFDRALQEAVHPQLVRAADPGPPLPLDQLRSAVRRQAPDVRLTAWYLPAHPGDLHRVMGQRGPERLQLAVEPASGRVRDRRGDIASVVPWLVYLHWGFTAGQWGALATGVLALALVVSSVTGLVVHRRGWAVFRPGRATGPGAARRRAADWHARTGLLSLVALVILGVTGFWMNRSAFNLLVGGRSEIRTLATGPDHAEQVSLDGLVAAARARIPDFTPRVIAFPKHPGRYLVVRGGVPSLNPLWHDRASALAVDPQSGLVRSVRDIRTAGWRTQLEAAVGPLHFGRWGGPLVGLGYVLAGLAPGVLALTGVLIWWRRTRLPRIAPPAAVAGGARRAAPTNARTVRLRVLRTLLLLAAGSAGPLAAQALFAPPATPLRLRAVRVMEPIRLDGRLDEPAWASAPLAQDFVQAEPRQGEPASVRTEVRVLYDDVNLYIAAFCADSGQAVRVRDLRRDFDDTTDDFFGVAIDGVRERRNAAVFRVNARGALRDQQSVDGGLSDVDFDAVWSARTTRSDSGWIAELAIPWQSLRYRAGTSTMGINFQRLIRRRNENTGWSPWPRALEPYRMDYAGVLDGLEPPPPSRNLRIIPYALAETRRTAAAASEAAGDAGVDLKWAVSPNAVLDLTTNPDFGQADVDRQVVNLTRFSVFFPERRQFFLENRGLFFTGNGSRFEPFFSRRIGIDEAGNPLAIRGGARFSARARGGAVGALAAVQEGTDSLPGASFAVLRAVRNLGRQDRLGALLNTRHDADGRTNAVGGVDWFVRPTPGSFVRGTLTASTTTGGAGPAAEGEGIGGFLWIANTANWGYVGYISELVTRRYDARTGFVLRNDYVRISPAVTLDWRPAWRPRWLRRLQPGFTLEHFVAASTGAVQEGFLSLRPLAGQFEHGGRFEYAVLPNWQRLASPFRPIPGIAIAPGSYDYLRHRVQYSSDPSARVAASVDASTGGYFDGRLHTLRTVVQATPDPRLALSADYTVNLLRDLGPTRTDLTTHLLGVESRLAASPRLQLVSFAQWNTSARQLTLNARLAWEYRPLAFVYLIYNDRSAVAGLGSPVAAPPTARQLLLKVTWLSQL